MTHGPIDCAQKNTRVQGGAKISTAIRWQARATPTSVWRRCISRTARRTMVCSALVPALSLACARACVCARALASGQVLGAERAARPHGFGTQRVKEFECTGYFVDGKNCGEPVIVDYACAVGSCYLSVLFPIGLHPSLSSAIRFSRCIPAVTSVPLQRVQAQAYSRGPRARFTATGTATTSATATASSCATQTAPLS